MSVTVDTSIQPVHDWIMTKHSRKESIPFDLDLIESGLIDSLSFIEFIFTIESASGKKINVEEINVDHFRTLSVIHKEYF